MDIANIIGGVFVIVGCIVIFIGAIGMVRFPDFYSRLHAGGILDTLGEELVLVGLIICSGFTPVSLKILIIIMIITMANPTSGHFLAKAANTAGLRYWRKVGKVDNKDVDLGTN